MNEQKIYYQINSIKYDPYNYDDIEETVGYFEDEDKAVEFFNNYEPLEDEQVELVQIINLMSK